MNVMLVGGRERTKSPLLFVVKLRIQHRLGLTHNSVVNKLLESAPTVLAVTTATAAIGTAVVASATASHIGHEDDLQREEEDERSNHGLAPVHFEPEKLLFDPGPPKQVTKHFDKGCLIRLQIKSEAKKRHGNVSNEKTEQQDASFCTTFRGSPC
jgi:hypothetical protein